MAKKTNFVTGAVSAVVGVSVCILAQACSSSTSAAPSDAGSGSDASTGPAGATLITSPPYAICDQVYLGYTYPGTYPTPATTSCSAPGSVTAGAADTHCTGQTPQPVSGSSCNTVASGDSGADDSPDAGSDYGPTMYGTEADDDDCKYHVSYTVSPICENDDTYFVVKATTLSTSAPLTGASTYAELFLGDTHPPPQVDGQPPSGKQIVVEGPPGTYTVGPVQFDAPGEWTVRFHFNEFCCDNADDSPHGHAAFYLTVP